MKETRLGVNVDHVATIRQARRITEPDPVIAAAQAELAGAHGITIHLREDRRHIQERDLAVMRETVKTKLNLEMAATPEMVEIALKYKPDIICLVPEKRQELTTEGGLDVITHFEKVKETVSALQDAGIPVSLFIDPDFKMIETSKNIGAEFIELHTGSYAEMTLEIAVERELKKLKDAAAYAADIGLRINAGHGLNYRNTTSVSRIPSIEELNIGHAIIGRAIYVGFERAVKEMLALL